jgi:hypothetical protein
VVGFSPVRQSCKTDLVSSTTRWGRHDLIRLRDHLLAVGAWEKLQEALGRKQEHGEGRDELRTGPLKHD